MSIPIAFVLTVQIVLIGVYLSIEVVGGFNYVSTNNN